jgi:predicted metalloprotease
MRWDDFRKSSNVEDRRGQIARAGGLGIGTMVILGLIAWGLGINPALLIGGAEMVSRHLPQSSSGGKPVDDQAGHFVAAVLGDTEDQWTAIFRATGKAYQPPKLVMYSGSTRSACGTAQAAVGPFYCPNDRTVYLDTAFFKDIETRLGGCEGKACQFSQAYVIAHEIGHHVQNQLGILPKVQALQARAGEAEGNQMQVRVELQADCFAGVWANHSQNKVKFLEPGDIEAALQTATAIGDDTLQKRSQGYVVPDAFTHGSSEQRKRWLLTGLKSGDVTSCDTFGSASL